MQNDETGDKAVPARLEISEKMQKKITYLGCINLN